MNLDRLALGLTALILTQSPAEAWGADDYEDIDLLKDPEKKTPKPEIIRKPVVEIEDTVSPAALRSMAAVPRTSTTSTPGRLLAKDASKP